MTKAEVVSAIANKTGVEKMAVLAVVEEFMTVVKDSLSEGENVYLRGFGSFIVRKRAEKTGHHSGTQHSGVQARQALHE